MPGTASRFIPPLKAAAYPATTAIRQLAQVLTEPVRHACEGRWREFAAAPGAGLERRRRPRVPAVTIAPHAPDRPGFVCISPTTKPVRRGVGADPQANLD